MKMKTGDAMKKSVKILSARQAKEPIQCALCEQMTIRFVKAHIPRCQYQTYKVHPECEVTLNYIVSPYHQEFLTLFEASEIVKEHKNMVMERLGLETELQPNVVEIDKLRKFNWPQSGCP